MNRQSHTTDRRLAQRGFTLIEAIVVIVIIGVLAALIGPRLFGRVDSAKIAAANSNAAAIASAVKLYAHDAGSLPESLNALVVKSDLPGSPYLENADQLKDPWGNPFKLIVPPQRNADFDVVCYGGDGQPGGEGVNADIVKP